MTLPPTWTWLLSRRQGRQEAEHNRMFAEPCAKVAWTASTTQLPNADAVERPRAPLLWPALVWALVTVAMAPGAIAGVITPIAIAAADVDIRYSELPTAEGGWIYELTIANTRSPALPPAYNIYDVVLNLGSAPNVAVGSLPNGWDFIPDIGAVELFAVNVGGPPFGSEIPPGATLGGFSLLLEQPLGSVPFIATLIDPAVPDSTYMVESHTIVVPEARSIDILAIGVVMVGMYWVIRQARSRSVCA